MVLVCATYVQHIGLFELMAVAGDTKPNARMIAVQA